MSSIPSAGARRRTFLRVEELERREVLSGYQPTAAEQLFLELLNDARANPAAYGAALGVDLSGIAGAQPLAFDTRLVQAARLHSADMGYQNYFGHNSLGGATPGQRIQSAGFSTASWGESIAAGYSTPAEALAALVRDDGVPSLGHRRHLLAVDAVFRGHNAVGVGIVFNAPGTYRNYYTIDSAASASALPYLTGVVYNDANGNGRYDLNEGLAGVSVAVQGAGATSTFDSGGYSIQLHPGTYSVTFSGGGLPTPITRLVSVGSLNHRLSVTSAASPNAGVESDAAWLGRMYQEHLGRAAGPGEINMWLSVFSAGASRQSVLAAILASPEYQNRSSSLWVRQAYRHLLQREAGPGEVGFWAGLLVGGASRDQIAAEILGSLEYRRTQGLRWLSQTFQDLLGRPLGPADLNYWVGVIDSGASPEAMTAFILASEEYRTRAGDPAGGWVAQVYRDLLKRSPAPGEVALWVGQLQHGVTRQQAASQFLASAEYAGRAVWPWVAQQYRDLLGREAQGSDLAAWAGVVLSGSGREGVLRGILASAEFNARLASLR